MEKMNYVEITGPAYKLRRYDLNGFTLSGTCIDTIELIFPTVSTPGFVEIVMHDKNQTETADIPLGGFIGFLKTKTDKVRRLNYHCIVCAQRDNPHNTANIFREHDSIPKKRAPLQDSLSQ